MKSTSIIGIATAIIVFFSCSNTHSPQASTKPEMENKGLTDWIILDKGSQCSIMEPKQVLAKSQAEFDAVWREAFESMDMPPTKPSVDFSANWVIAVFLGEKNKGGFEIDIQAISQTHGSTVITIKEIKPGPNCLSTMSIEYPYLLASMPRQSAEKVEFTSVEAIRNCD